MLSANRKKLLIQGPPKNLKEGSAVNGRRSCKNICVNGIVLTLIKGMKNANIRQIDLSIALTSGLPILHLEKALH
jgi:hypothetical protein